MTIHDYENMLSIADNNGFICFKEVVLKAHCELIHYRVLYQELLI